MRILRAEVSLAISVSISFTILAVSTYLVSSSQVATAYKFLLDNRSMRQVIDRFYIGRSSTTVESEGVHHQSFQLPVSPVFGMWPGSRRASCR
jgi:hypothetical protein